MTCVEVQWENGHLTLDFVIGTLALSIYMHIQCDFHFRDAVTLSRELHSIPPMNTIKYWLSCGSLDETGASRDVNFPSSSRAVIMAFDNWIRILASLLVACAQIELAVIHNLT